MSKEAGRRGLSGKPFMQDLRKGLLSSLLQRVQDDSSLDMEIRQEYINIYYRGGNLLRVNKNKNGPGYSAYFEAKYGPSIKHILPDANISSSDDAARWLSTFPVMKNAMDLWFGEHPKAERASQQMVVYENNVSPWAGATDYFIVDIEYDNHKGARFDLVALRWDSTVTARKLQREYLPILTAVELKTGDGALKGDAGLLEHYRQWEEFFADPCQLNNFKQEMLNVLKQKRDLGLIPALENNPNEIVRVADRIDVVFLLANHDPASSKLVGAVDDILREQKKNPSNIIIKFGVANFLGFGLYSQNILSVEDFRCRI